MSKFGAGAERCVKCEQRVYPTEKVSVDSGVYHKTCLKCKTCQKVLSLGTYAGMNGETFCKPHFKQLFLAKGNYDEGFGREQHKKKWAEQEASGNTASTTPASEAQE